MADGMALPRVITKELFSLWTIAFRPYEGKSLELTPPGSRSRESGTSRESIQHCIGLGAIFFRVILGSVHRVESTLFLNVFTTLLMPYHGDIGYTD